MSDYVVASERARLIVAFFIHTPKDPQTAVFNSVNLRARYLTSVGHAAVVVSPEDFSWLSKVGARWYTLLYAWAVAAYLVRRRRRITIAVFHSHAGWVFNLIRPLSKTLRKIRTVTQFHGLEPLFFEQLSSESKRLSLRFRLMQGFLGNILVKSSCRRSDQVQCLNSVERKYLTTQRWASPEKVVQYANGVARDVIATRQYLGPTRRLLFVGQWIERKGIRTLAEAFGKVKEKSPDLELWCVGTRWDRERVLSDFPAHLRDAVRVIARVPSAEIKQYLDEAHIFVFPTLFEGFSMALIEAMGAGLPIITTDVAAASELLRDGESALFVPLNSVNYLVAAIEKLVADQFLQERLGRQAQAISREYEWDSVCARYTQSLVSLAAT